MPYITCNTFRVTQGRQHLLNMNLDKAATETNRGAACSHGRLCDVSQIITLPNDHPHNAQEATLLTRTINGNGGAKPALGRSCEEYPFASTTQGGQNINSRCIPFYEQHMQKKILAGVRYAVEDLATCLVPEGSNKAVIIARAKQVDINLILEGVSNAICRSMETSMTANT